MNLGTGTFEWIVDDIFDNSGHYGSFQSISFAGPDVIFTTYESTNPLTGEISKEPTDIFIDDSTGEVIKPQG